MEHEERLESMMELTHRLADLVETENLALVERRNADVENMLEEKATLSRLYENRFKALEELNVNWGQLGEEKRQEMANTAERLKTLTDENVMRLKVAAHANQAVLEAVADAVRANTPHAGTYAKNGKQGQEGMRAAANSMSVSLDQSL